MWLLFIITWSYFSDEQKPRHTWHGHITRLEDIKLRENNNVWHKGKAAWLRACWEKMLVYILKQDDAPPSKRKRHGRVQEEKPLPCTLNSYQIAASESISQLFQWPKKLTISKLQGQSVNSVMSRPVIERRVGSTVNSALATFGRNLKIATCPGTRSEPLAYTESGEREERRRWETETEKGEHSRLQGTPFQFWICDPHWYSLGLAGTPWVPLYSLDFTGSHWYSLGLSGAHWVSLVEPGTSL